MIIGVALKGTGLFSYAEAPARHYTLLDALLNWKHPIPDDFEAGFITNKYEFLNRTDALTHAIECGQRPDTVGTELRSVDLW